MTTRAGSVAGLIGATCLACGCMFGSDPAKPSEPYLVLGDTSSFAVEWDAASSLEDSGLSAIWTDFRPGWIYYEHLDSAGRFQGEGFRSYADSASFASPRVSAYPFPGHAMAWIEWARPAVEWRIAVLLRAEPYFNEYPLYPPLQGLRAVISASILALPDTGFVLGAEGFDSSGNEPFLLIQRYDARANPVGEPWFGTPHASLGAPELARREKGGWTAVWNGYKGDEPEVAWQAFDASGAPDGPRRSETPPGMVKPPALRLQPLRDGRLLIGARSEPDIPFILGADGVAETGSPFPEARDVVAMATDTAHGRIYGVQRDKVVRMDSAFRIQGERPIPSVFMGTPETVVLPSGKIILIAHGNGSVPRGEQHALLAVTMDPF